MKRYLAFYGDIYYPLGGTDDLLGDYATVSGAKKAITIRNKQKVDKGRDNWGFIYDTKDKKKIWTSTGDLKSIYG